MFETEKATNRVDLPHSWQAKCRCPDTKCQVCGREFAHELHKPVMTEQASRVETFITEKGI